GVTVATARPLGHAERAAPPGQWITLGQMPGTWITQRVTQPVFVAGGTGAVRGQGQQSDLLPGRQNPADGFGGGAEHMLRAGDLQFDLDRCVQVVLHYQRIATRMLAGGHVHLTVVVLDHVVVEHEYPGAGYSLVGVGDYAIGVSV